MFRLRIKGIFIRMLTIKQLNISGYDKVIEAVNQSAGLHCFIAIHDRSLGPAMGGTRIYPYLTQEDALSDVLRLSKAMTYKSAMAENGLGGGKSVIIADPSTHKNRDLLLAFAEVVDSLEGAYIAAEDSGTTPEDMATIRERTPYVGALPGEKSSGDPSRFTAWGVFRGMEAVAEKLWGRPLLRGRKIAIQGVGSVGSKLVNILFWEGAHLFIADTDVKKCWDACHLYGAQMMSLEEILTVECDIFAPCALGGVLNEETVPQLRCSAIAGAANNQLVAPEFGETLRNAHILYAPDYVINAGGIINAAMEFAPQGYDPKASRDKVNQIYDVLLMIFLKAESEGKSTSQVADELAEYKLHHRIGKRAHPIVF